MYQEGVYDINTSLDFMKFTYNKFKITDTFVLNIVKILQNRLNFIYVCIYLIYICLFFSHVSQPKRFLYTFQ